MLNLKVFGALPVLLALFSIIILGENSFAQTYRWVDDKGVMHFSDNPPPPSSMSPKAPAKSPEPVEPSPSAVKTAPGKIAKGKGAAVLKKDDAPEKRKKSTKLYDIRGKVARTVGVDMIVLESGKRIKYIGVKDPSRFLSKNGMDAKSKDAYDYHEKLVKGKTVTVLLGEMKKDKKGAYLGHVFLGQQAFVNAELIRNGYALTEDYPSDFEYQSLFIRLQNYAREKGLGIWKF